MKCFTEYFRLWADKTPQSSGNTFSESVIINAMSELFGADASFCEDIHTPAFANSDGLKRDNPIVVLSDGCYSRKMNKKHMILRRMSDAERDDFVPGIPEERIGMVWPLTVEITSLSKRYNAKQRLQRNVAMLSRRKG